MSAEERIDAQPPPFAREAHMRFINSFFPSRKQRNKINEERNKVTASTATSSLSSTSSSSPSSSSSSIASAAASSTAAAAEATPSTPSFQKLATEYLRLSGLYWGVMALELVHADSNYALDRGDVLKFILSCRHPYAPASSLPSDDGKERTSRQKKGITDAGAAVDIEGGKRGGGKEGGGGGEEGGEGGGGAKDGIGESLKGKEDEHNKQQVNESEIGKRATSCYTPSLGYVDGDVTGRVVVMYDRNVLPGGFGGSRHHDPHILYTCSAVQLLAIYGALDQIDADAVARQIASLQLPDGSFQGDCWGEIDTRFSYNAVLTLSILNRLDAIDQEQAAAYIHRCVKERGGGLREREREREREMKRPLLVLICFVFVYSLFVVYCFPNTQSLYHSKTFLSSFPPPPPPLPPSQPPFPPRLPPSLKNN